MNANKIKILKTELDQFVNIPVNMQWDFMGRDDSISEYETDALRRVIGLPVDFEIAKFVHNTFPNIDSSIDYEFYFYDDSQPITANTVGNWGITYLNEGFSPEEVYSEFVEVSKENEENPDYVIEKAKHQLEGVDLNELYYTHKKIAPFVRHFVGVKKVMLDFYIEVAQQLKMELKSVIPWNFLLPKYTNSLEPSLFIVLGDNSTVFSLSEYNNIYFSKSYNRRFKVNELEDYVNELSLVFVYF